VEVLRSVRILPRAPRLLAGVALALAVVLATTGSAFGAARPNSATASGTALAGPSVCYRAHVQDTGWQSWKCNGSTAGTIGESRRLEALQLTTQGVGRICANAHVQNIGWQGNWCAYDGQTVQVGTVGRGLRMEALTLSVPSGNVCAAGHVQDLGWQGFWCGRAVTIGTTGQSLRLEAVSIYV
jgi:uncharacterized protein YjdB